MSTGPCLTAPLVVFDESLIEPCLVRRQVSVRRLAKLGAKVVRVVVAVDSATYSLRLILL